jgi:pimeloyl-[acyl-carrier protein] methyl ester esterase
VSLHIDTQGHGQDVVLIHGWGIHGGVWSRVAEALASSHCVHSVDLPGCGHSAPVTPYTLDMLADTLAQAFPLPVHVVGWSLGGAVGTHWALRHPGAVRSLSLVASSPCFMQRTDWQHATPAETLAAFTDSLANDYTATLEMFLGLQVMGSRDGRTVLRALKDAVFSRPTPSPTVLYAGLAILRDTDLRPHLPRLDMPVSLHFGERDRITPPEAGHWLAHTLGAPLTLYAGGGHAPFISHEAAFMAALRTFLARA